MRTLTIALVLDPAHEREGEALQLALRDVGVEVLCFPSLDRIETTDRFDLIHVLSSSVGEGLREAPWACEQPCFVQTSVGWQAHIFGFQPAAHGMHARQELSLRGVPHPLDEEPHHAAARWAFRYRQLLCMSRATFAYQRWGFEADSIRGELRREDEVLGTLGPSAAQVEFDLPPLGNDVHWVEVQTKLVSDDIGQARCGIVALDGQELGRLGELEVARAPAIITERFPVRVPVAGGRLTITNQTANGKHSICRLRSVRLERSAPCDPYALLEIAVESNVGSDSERATVKVVIATLDGERRLRTCLPALFNSTFAAERLEVILIDYGSSEKTARWLARNYPQVERIDPSANIGFTQAANLGAASGADADITVFLNDDAVVEPEFLAELVRPLEQRRCHCTAARMLLPDGKPEYFGGAGSFQGLAFGGPADAVEAQRLDLPRKTLFACGGAMAIRSEVFRTVGGFDPDYFAYYDDIDLGWRLWVQGYDVHYVPTAICTHARSSTSSAFPAESVRLIQMRNALCTCIKNLGDDALRATLPALLALHDRRMWIQAEHPYVGKIRIEHLRPHKRKFFRSYRLPWMAMADLAGMHDVLGDWDKWMAKRAVVQASRKRLDVEVLPLFLDPLRCVEGEAEYEALQSSLIDLFRLESVFGMPGTRPPIE